jgi:hypothetical protein
MCKQTMRYVMIERWIVLTNNERVYDWKMECTNTNKQCEEIWFKDELYKQTMSHVMNDWKLKCSNKPWGM